jgi:hypothetical protein
MVQIPPILTAVPQMKANQHGGLSRFTPPVSRLAITPRAGKKQRDRIARPRHQVYWPREGGATRDQFESDAFFLLWWSAEHNHATRNFAFATTP